MTYAHAYFLGADSLVGKLTERLNKTTHHKLILAHMPLIMVCIEVSFIVSTNKLQRKIILVSLSFMNKPN